MKPVTTEKAVMIIERQNTLTFELEKKMTKTEIKKEEPASAESSGVATEKPKVELKDIEQQLDEILGE